MPVDNVEGTSSDDEVEEVEFPPPFSTLTGRRVQKFWMLLPKGLMSRSLINPLRITGASKRAISLTG